MVNVVPYLERSDLFAGLDAETLERIAAGFRPVRAEKDQALCSEGDAGDRFFIVTRGEVAVMKETPWGARELKRLGTGEIFGEMALITGEKRTATVRALSAVECLEMVREEFARLLDADSRFAQRVLRILTARLRYSDEHATQELLNAQQTLIFSLAQLADSRDPETGAHLQRVREYCSHLADCMSRHPRYHGEFYPGFIESLHFVAPLHDIGKVAVPDAVLLKEGKLTEDEFEIMKGHAAAGARTVRAVCERCDHPVFRMAYNLVRHHHERWDGGGYPDGLKGEAIPVEARIMSLADVYDALLSRRVYKPPFTYVEARDIIREGGGLQFDPLATEIMLQNIKGFEAIHRHYQEEAASGA